MGANALWCLEAAWGQFDPCAAPLGNGRCLREAATRRLGFDPAKRPCVSAAKGLMTIDKYVLSIWSRLSLD
jgi:hypothetical protein